MHNVKLLSTPVPRHSFRWTPKCMSHSIRERECNIIAACECDYLGLNVIAWNHCRSDPVQVQSTLPMCSMQCGSKCLNCTRVVLQRPALEVLMYLGNVPRPPHLDVVPTEIRAPPAGSQFVALLGAHCAPSKIQEVTLMRPFHGNL